LLPSSLRFMSMPKILCIDDNVHGLTARRVLLEGMGHKVIVARSGREGLDAFRSQKVDMVIIDYVMPQMNGGEVIREIRRTNPKLPVILLSGYTETLGLEEKVPEADCVMKKGSREVSELTNAMTRLFRKSMKKPGASVKAKDVKPKERKTLRRQSRS
jgi:CheY-like chemotaxis protein